MNQIKDEQVRLNSRLDEIVGMLGKIAETQKGSADSLEKRIAPERDWREETKARGFWLNPKTYTVRTFTGRRRRDDNSYHLR